MSRVSSIDLFTEKRVSPFTMTDAQFNIAKEYMCVNEIVKLGISNIGVTAWNKSGVNWVSWKYLEEWYEDYQCDMARIEKLKQLELYDE